MSGKLTEAARVWALNSLRVKAAHLESNARTARQRFSTDHPFFEAGQVLGKAYEKAKAAITREIEALEKTDG